MENFFHFFPSNFPGKKFLKYGFWGAPLRKKEKKKLGDFIKWGLGFSLEKRKKFFFGMFFTCLKKFSGRWGGGNSKENC